MQRSTPLHLFLLRVVVSLAFKFGLLVSPEIDLNIFMNCLVPATAVVARGSSQSQVTFGQHNQLISCLT
jgi:hypothetical protein